MKSTVIKDGVRLDRDVAVAMRDGAHLMVNVAYTSAAPASAAGEIVPVDIEILASSTLFEAGSRLSVDVLGRDANQYPAFHHGRTINRGTHAIHTGARFDSHLLAPVVCAEMKGHQERRAS